MFEDDPFSNFGCMLQFIFVCLIIKLVGICPYMLLLWHIIKLTPWNEKNRQNTKVYSVSPKGCYIISLSTNQSAVTCRLFVCTRPSKYQSLIFLFNHGSETHLQKISFKDNRYCLSRFDHFKAIIFNCVHIRTQPGDSFYTDQ